MLVVIAVEEDGPGIGRIRMARITDKSRGPLHAFVQAGDRAGQRGATDGLPAYRGLETMGYEHEVTVLLGQEKDAAIPPAESSSCCLSSEALDWELIKEQ